ncbi:MAG: hypothetical protein K2L97_08130, partial [Muribaculaceae bacterium]|nr:hypothetical protein [Muribaculaceae bacterium]
MRKLTLYIILIITLSALCGSCRKASPPHPALSLADSLMETSPDSALTLLCNLDTSILTTPADHPLYHLLLTQAQVKTGITPSPDNYRLENLVDYYHTHPDNKRHLMLALYLLGYYYITSGDYEQALQPLLEAKQIAIELDNQFQLGLIYRQIATVYQQAYDAPDDLLYEEKAVDAFRQSGNEEYTNYELYNYAMSTYFNGDNEKALALLSQVKQKAEELQDTVTIIDAFSGQMLIHYALGDFSSVISDSDTLGLLDAEIDLNNLQLLAISYDYLNQFQKADSILSIVISRDGHTFAGLHHMYASRGDYKNAYYSQLKLLHYTDSVFAKLSRQQIIHKTILIQEAEARQHKISANKSQRRFILACIITGLLSVIIPIIIIYYRRSLIHKNRDLLISLETLSTEFKAKLRQSESDNNARTARVEILNSIYQNRYTILDEICRAYSEKPDNTQPYQYARLLHNTISKLKAQPEFLERLTEEFDISSDHLYSDLKKHGARFSKDDLALLIYIVSGFSIGSISLFMSLSKTIIY